MNYRLDKPTKKPQVTKDPHQQHHSDQEQDNRQLNRSDHLVNCYDPAREQDGQSHEGHAEAVFPEQERCHDDESKDGARQELLPAVKPHRKHERRARGDSTGKHPQAQKHICTASCFEEVRHWLSGEGAGNCACSN